MIPGRLYVGFISICRTWFSACFYLFLFSPPLRRSKVGGWNKGDGVGLASCGSASHVTSSWIFFAPPTERPRNPGIKREDEKTKSKYINVPVDISMRLLPLRRPLRKWTVPAPYPIDAFQFRARGNRLRAGYNPPPSSWWCGQPRCLSIDNSPAAALIRHPVQSFCFWQTIPNRSTKTVAAHCGQEKKARQSF